MQTQDFSANRALAVQKLRERLSRDSFPRMQMSFLVALTGGFGLVTSYVLLQLGLDSMALRYPLALFFAYLFFLFLLWLWLRTNAQDYMEAPDISGFVTNRGTTSAQPDVIRGHGGTFDGGGASGDYESTAVSTDGISASSSSPIGQSAGSVADADELAIPLVVIALAAGIALASLYVVYIAPILFAEMLVDGALSYALFRRLHGKDPQHWLVSTFQHTFIPFLATAVFLFVAGAAMSNYAPGAASLGQVLKYSRSQPMTR